MQGPVCACEDGDGMSGEGVFEMPGFEEQYHQGHYRIWRKKKIVAGPSPGRDRCWNMLLSFVRRCHDYGNNGGISSLSIYAL
jgi:hypothetical protein